ncbi:Scm-like with four MBT domains protein 1 [Merluccius polli]|uniref:Scm-like with four MBT domains protein 1 n=1 Tax=Merluccius polli TaxID=89951 RepID=A0AA47N7X6_MERPO|nr:Scm-like with four MBT domains protein 1 [Merluccius polli]
MRTGALCHIGMRSRNDRAEKKKQRLRDAAGTPPLSGGPTRSGFLRFTSCVVVLLVINFPVVQLDCRYAAMTAVRGREASGSEPRELEVSLDSRARDQGGPGDRGDQWDQGTRGDQWDQGTGGTSGTRGPGGPVGPGGTRGDQGTRGPGTRQGDTPHFQTWPVGGTNMSQKPLESDRDSGQDVSDFNWDDYLEESGASSVPHHAFKHVDQGLQTGLAPGMRLEVCVRAEADAPYWVATIITTCGQLLLLRYEGYHEDRRADFWCDIMMADLHPLGWSRQQGKTMRAPEGVREKHQDWEVLLETALAEGGSAPANLLEMPQRGPDPAELLCAGCYVELQDPSAAGLAWAAEVEENVGGRLKLRPLGAEGLADTPSTVWLYYLHPRLHPPGWAQEHGCTLTPPQGLLALRTAEEWEEVRQRILELPQDDALEEVFPKDQPAITTHSFKEGMKLEAVDPVAPISISPATVTKVFNELYFLVKMDDLCGIDEGDVGGRPFLCHRESPGIFPVEWSLKNGLPLRPPPGYQGQDFDWADYLKQSEAEAAPQHCFSQVSLTPGSCRG